MSHYHKISHENPELSTAVSGQQLEILAIVLFYYYFFLSNYVKVEVWFRKTVIIWTIVSKTAICVSNSIRNYIFFSISCGTKNEMAYLENAMKN